MHVSGIRARLEQHRFMKRHGFMIYNVEVNRYSCAALPSPFVYTLPAKTLGGQPLWGDAIFLRDLVAPEYGPAMPTISPLIDPAALLNLRTPAPDGQALPYRDHTEAVSANPRRVFPGG